MTRINTLLESSFLATFRLMLHIKNRGQPIRAAACRGKPRWPKTVDRNV